MANIARFKDGELNLQRPLHDQLDFVHVECSRHMRVLDVDEKTGNFLVGCDTCHLQLIVSRFVEPQAEEIKQVEQEKEEIDVESKPVEERITAASDPKTDYVPKKRLARQSA
jgi:hypothetical protein